MMKAVMPLDIIIAAYGDSSFGNAQEAKSQAGLLIAATSKEALLGQHEASVLEWRSHRLKRATRSTLSAEACAMDAAADHGYYLAAILSEALFCEKPSGTRRPKIEVYVLTDCKSLYDSLLRLSPSVQDKRTQIELASIREMISQDGLRWIPTTEMQADGLTKRNPQLRENLRRYMMKAHVRLREQPEELG
jgi:hypothetical protein